VEHFATVSGGYNGNQNATQATSSTTLMVKPGIYIHIGGTQELYYAAICFRMLISLRPVAFKTVWSYGTYYYAL
jgi:hypothetical protein